MTDEAMLIRDKYDGNASVDLTEDRSRLSYGEPLAYVIGWIPFLGLRIELDSRPLIPRPETEWWTESLLAHIKKTKGEHPFSFLDLCAGSGAIGLSVLHTFKNATVSFGELQEEHVTQIKRNLEVNGLDASRAIIKHGDLFTPFAGERFDFIASNPPYVPADRTLDQSVTEFEPAVALYSGLDGLDCIRRIGNETPSHMNSDGELWLECDSTHADEAARLIKEGGADSVEIRNDLYGRPRISVGYYA